MIGGRPVNTGVRQGGPVTRINASITQPRRPIMTTVFILRKERNDARRLIDAIERTPRLEVVGSADTLARARRAFGELQIDVLVCDLRFDDGSALSLVHDLFRDPQHASQTRILLLTTATADALLIESLRAGADGYFIDHLDAMSNVGLAIAEVARGESQMSAGIARHVLVQFDRREARNRGRQPGQPAAIDPLRLRQHERHLLTLLAKGSTVAEIARDDDVMPSEIRHTIREIYRKMQRDLRAEMNSSLQAA